MGGAKARRHQGTKGKPIALGVFVVISFCVCVGAGADSFSLPLQGYFHPGRAMPVRWDISSTSVASGILQVSASDAITTRVKWGGNPRGVFPWMVTGENVGNIRAQLPGEVASDLPPLHPLQDSDWLVMCAPSDEADARFIFAGRHVVFVPLDADDLFEGPAMAWETLDAVLLMPKEVAKMSPPVRQGLIASGVEFAVKGGDRPEGFSLGNKVGDWWLASAGIKLPPMVDAEAYAPTYGWMPGRTDGFRRRIFYFGAIYCLAICGTALWRSRWMPVAIVAVSIAAAVIFAQDNQRQSPLSRQGGLVRLTGLETGLDDRWVYLLSHRDFDFEELVDHTIRPIFYDSTQAARLNLTLECDEHGEPDVISGRLGADEPLALMSRQATYLGENNSPAIPAVSPLRLLANESTYPGFHVVRQISSPIRDGFWPSVVFAKGQ